MMKCRGDIKCVAMNTGIDPREMEMMMRKGRRVQEAPAVAERGYGNGPDFASVTLDFGDFSYMSATVPVKGGRRLADAAAATPAPVPASVAAGGFDPLRATALAKLAAAAACSPAGVELKE